MNSQETLTRCNSSRESILLMYYYYYYIDIGQISFSATATPLYTDIEKYIIIICR